MKNLLTRHIERLAGSHRQVEPRLPSKYGGRSAEPPAVLPDAAEERDGNPLDAESPAVRRAPSPMAAPLAPPARFVLPSRAEAAPAVAEVRAATPPQQLQAKRVSRKGAALDRRDTAPASESSQAAGLPVSVSLSEREAAPGQQSSSALREAGGETAQPLPDRARSVAPPGPSAESETGSLRWQADGGLGDLPMPPEGPAPPLAVGATTRRSGELAEPERPDPRPATPSQTGRELHAVEGALVAGQIEAPVVGDRPASAGDKPAAAGGERAMSSPEAGRSARGAPGPIRISIGRIEVRATSEASRPASAAPPSVPRTSLAELMRQSSGRRS